MMLDSPRDASDTAAAISPAATRPKQDDARGETFPLLLWLVLSAPAKITGFAHSAQVSASSSGKVPPIGDQASSPENSRCVGSGSSERAGPIRERAAPDWRGALGSGPIGVTKNGAGPFFNRSVGASLDVGREGLPEIAKPEEGADTAVISDAITCLGTPQGQALILLDSVVAGPVSSAPASMSDSSNNSSAAPGAVGGGEPNRTVEIGDNLASSESGGGEAGMEPKSASWMEGAPQIVKAETILASAAENLLGKSAPPKESLERNKQRAASSIPSEIGVFDGAITEESARVQIAGPDRNFGAPLRGEAGERDRAGEERSNEPSADLFPSTPRSQDNSTLHDKADNAGVQLSAGAEERPTHRTIEIDSMPSQRLSELPPSVVPLVSPQQAGSAAPDAPANSWRPVIERVSEELAARLKLGKDKAVIQLDPPELGKIRIDLHVQGDKLQARIVAETHESRALIENHLQELRQALQARDLQIIDLRLIGSGRGGFGDGARGFAQQQQQSGRDQQWHLASADPFDQHSTESQRSARPAAHRGLVSMWA